MVARSMCSGPALGELRCDDAANRIHTTTGGCPNYDANRLGGKTLADGDAATGRKDKAMHADTSHKRGASTHHVLYAGR